MKKLGPTLALLAPVFLYCACQHLLEIRATDTDGNQRIIARQRILVTE